ncbi:MAG: radical SAM protein [Planctomycetota bacterium]|nr:radical SAM protein [Planctomycetota bacterium]MDI6786782.1 radical SAM protein [Planctomycetota bacterium]
MRYEEPIYRPPSEADSLLIQATIGCPHNKCTFCGMYKDKTFRIRSVQEIKEDILLAKQFYGDTVESIFFPDGNSIIMKTTQLEEIFRFAHQTFPGLRRITMYASAKFLRFKSLEDLKRLKTAGLNRLHKGLESGYDEILKRIQKGADSKLMIETALRVKNAGIELSEYVLIGIGGKDFSREHTMATADVLNKIDPDFIRLRTWVPVPNAPLYQDYLSGKFQLLSPHEALRETRLLLERLEVSCLFLSDHISNFVNISGHLPRDKESMLSKIDEMLELSESRFRPAIIENL